MKICARKGCHNAFEPTNHVQKYCDDPECRLQRHRENMREYARKHRGERRGYFRDYQKRGWGKQTVQLRKMGITQSDILHAPAERAARMINGILRGREVYVG